MKHLCRICKKRKRCEYYEDNNEKVIECGEFQKA